MEGWSEDELSEFRRCLCPCLADAEQHVPYGLYGAWKPEGPTIQKTYTHPTPITKNTQILGTQLWSVWILRGSLRNRGCFARNPAVIWTPDYLTGGE